MSVRSVGKSNEQERNKKEVGTEGKEKEAGWKINQRVKTKELDEQLLVLKEKQQSQTNPGRVYKRELTITALLFNSPAKALIFIPIKFIFNLFLQLKFDNIHFIRPHIECSVKEQPLGGSTGLRESTAQSDI